MASELLVPVCRCCSRRNTEVCRITAYRLQEARSGWQRYPAALPGEQGENALLLVPSSELMLLTPSSAPPYARGECAWTERCRGWKET